MFVVISQSAKYPRTSKENQSYFKGIEYDDNLQNTLVLYVENECSLAIKQEI